MCKFRARKGIPTSTRGRLMCVEGATREGRKSGDEQSHSCTGLLQKRGSRVSVDRSTPVRACVTFGLVRWRSVEDESRCESEGWMQLPAIRDGAPSSRSILSFISPLGLAGSEKEVENGSTSTRQTLSEMPGSPPILDEWSGRSPGLRRSGAPCRRVRFQSKARKKMRPAVRDLSPLRLAAFPLSRLSVVSVSCQLSLPAEELCSKADVAQWRSLRRVGLATDQRCRLGLGSSRCRFRVSPAPARLQPSP